MLTTTMDHPSRDHPQFRSPPFQTRAFHFLKSLALRARRTDRKSVVPVAPVVIPTQDRPRARASIDLLRKPDIRLFGLRAEDGANPMDADDSSQDASASGNTPRLRLRRHSAFDALPTAPIHPAFAAHGATPVFCRDHVGKAILDKPVSPVNLLPPPPLFLRTSASLDVVAQPPRSPVIHPDSPPQTNDSPETKAGTEPAQEMLHDDTPRPPRDDFPHHPTTSSVSSDPNMSSSIQSLPEDPASESTLKRPALLSHHSAPSPPPFRVTTERRLRLSPSIITRQPMPLLNLPTLPPPPPTSETPPRHKVPLRSIPSLSRLGYGDDTGCQADREDAGLGDSEEEEGDEGDEEEEHANALSIHQSDDEDDEPESAGAGPSSAQGFKSSHKQRIKDEQAVAERSPSQGDFADADVAHSKTHVKAVESSGSLAMRPRTPNALYNKDVDQRHPLDHGLVTSGGRLENRPSLYRVASRSLDNLGSTRRSESEKRLRSRETTRSNLTSAAGRTVDMHAESDESDTEIMVGRLLRRTSMPSFHPTSDPPPYPSFNPRPKESHVSSREDEGLERLPPYINSLYLIAIMPRKMEFCSPGIQAKDRKWRRVVCELEGTTLRVYKCPPGASGAGVLGDWWEKRMGVGDVACPNPPRTRKKEEQVERSAKLGIDEPQVPAATATPSRQSTSGLAAASENRQRSESQSSAAVPLATTSTPRQAKRISGASFLSPFRSSSSSRPEPSAGETVRSRRESGEVEVVAVDAQDNQSSVSHESAVRTPAAQRLSQPPQPRSASRLSFLPVSTGRAQWRSGEEVPKPAKSDLLRAYTLQHAESGLGNDYLKRKNVIRVRLEGEQFLLQAPDVPAVVEWIEGLHAGTNIALDLDQRPMPKGPMFPRRRRRRARATQEETSGERAPQTR